MQCPETSLWVGMRWLVSLRGDSEQTQGSEVLVKAGITGKNVLGRAQKAQRPRGSPVPWAFKEGRGGVGMAIVGGRRGCRGNRRSVHAGPDDHYKNVGFGAGCSGPYL